MWPFIFHAHNPCHHAASAHISKASPFSNLEKRIILPHRRVSSGDVGKRTRRSRRIKSRPRLFLAITSSAFPSSRPGPVGSFSHDDLVIFNSNTRYSWFPWDYAFSPAFTRRELNCRIQPCRAIIKYTSGRHLPLRVHRRYNPATRPTLTPTRDGSPSWCESTCRRRKSAASIPKQAASSKAKSTWRLHLRGRRGQRCLPPARFRLPGHDRCDHPGRHCSTLPNLPTQQCRLR